MLKVGDKVRYKKEYLSQRPTEDRNEEINEYTILSVDGNGYGYVYEIGTKKAAMGYAYGGYQWRVIENQMEQIYPASYKEMTYEEPEMDEFDDNCLSTCKPANHMCGKK